MTEKVEKGIITSTRRVLDIGGSKAVTLPRKWVDIQKWLGKEVTELVSLANDCIILVAPDQVERATWILKQIKEGKRTNSKEASEDNE